MKAEVEAEDQEENAAAKTEGEGARPSTAPVTSGLELELEPVLSSTLSTTNAQWHLIHSERHLQEQREAEANGVSAPLNKVMFRAPPSLDAVK